MHGVDVVAQGGDTGSLHQEGPQSHRERSSREAKGRANSRGLDSPQCQQRRQAGNTGTSSPSQKQAPELRVRKDHSQSPPKESRLQQPTPVLMPSGWGLTPPAAPAPGDSPHPLSLSMSVHRSLWPSMALLCEENVLGLFLTKATGLA